MWKKDLSFAEKCQSRVEAIYIKFVFDNMSDIKMHSRQSANVQNAYFYKSIVAFTLKLS